MMARADPQNPPIQTIAIVGANIAGASTAEALRRAGYDGRLTLIGAEPELPYERPPLSKEFLAGHVDAAQLTLRPRAFYDEQRIELWLGQRATALDAAARTIALANGERHRFDRIALATGSELLPLPVPGADLPGVHYLRTVADGQVLLAALRAGASHGGRVVVIGAGFIGSEVAAGCRVAGMDVTLIEMLATPMERALGPEMGALLAEVHRAHGVEVRAGETVAAIRGHGRAEEVVTASGARIPCDFAVVGAGVRPTTDWLADSGLTLANGVVVDATCASSAPGIFAAGDVANWPYQPAESAPLLRVRLEHWDNALRQGETVARNLLGEGVAYRHIPYFWSDQYDLKLQYVGYTPTWDQIVVRGNPPESFVAFYLLAGRVRAAFSSNRQRDLVTLKKLIGADPLLPPDLLADDQRPLKELLKLV
jgi:3-phenylpropionate/trans-cinnamate dioxygenase ferredoxin reductase subunit